MVSDRRGEDFSTLQLLDDGETWPHHLRTKQHLCAFHWLWIFHPWYNEAYFSALILLCVLHIQLPTANLAFGIYWVPKAIQMLFKALIVFFLFAEYDKLLQQLSKQCGELFTVGSSSLQNNLCEMCQWLEFWQQLCCVGNMIIQLKAMLINCSVSFRILLCWAPQTRSTVF